MMGQEGIEQGSLGCGGHLLGDLSSPSIIQSCTLLDVKHQRYTQIYLLPVLNRSTGGTPTLSDGDMSSRGKIAGI